MVLRKKLLFGTVIVLLFFGGVAYALWFKDDPAQNQINTEDTGGPPLSATDAQEGTQEQPLPSKPGASGSSENNTKGVNVTISHLSQDEVTVYVRAFVEGATGGTCTLKLEKGGYSSVQKTAPIAAIGETFTCQGFNIAKSDIPAKGTWSVKVSFAGNNKTGTSETKNINIQ